MKLGIRSLNCALAICFATSIGLPAAAQAPSQNNVPSPAHEENFEPFIGQPGRDVVWEPSPEVTVEKMLDVAKVTPDDYVIDLGSGDGRMVIAAAKRGVRGHGVEFNPKMVALSNRRAMEAGVAERAKFVQGDMFTANLSQATVLPLFLLPENLNKLAPSFLQLKPGTRIVMNGFIVDGWDADEAADVEGDCGRWCSVFLYIVPADVRGTWKIGEQTLELQQKFQMLSGMLGGQPISSGRMRGDVIEFSVNATTYRGRVDGKRIIGRAQDAAAPKWIAEKI